MFGFSKKFEKIEKYVTCFQNFNESTAPVTIKKLNQEIKKKSGI